MIRVELNGTWEMNAVSEEDCTKVEIPGSVMSGLMAAGKIEDPFYRMNEYEANELFYKDFEFKKEFTAEDLFLENGRIELVCEGLDTLSEIYINSVLLAKTDNMHRTYVFDCKKLLKQGVNEIKIIFRSVHKYRTEYQDEQGKEITYVPCGCMRGNQYLRKAHCMFGWDWGAGIPDAGIWRDIYFLGYSEAKLTGARIRQNHENGRVSLCVEPEIEFLSEEAQTVQAVLTAPDGQRFAQEMLCEKGKDHTIRIDVENPMLWWPNGMGEQPLYRLSLSMKDQEKSYTIGLRTLTVSQDKDEWGNEFCFKVNGVRIFAMGADYIPEDTVYSHITPQRIRYLLKSCKRAHFNTIRIWGGGYYPSDEFYEICDEYGLIVWQDFMFACNVYDVNDHFAENIAAEVRDNARRIRHHACLGLWCGNNEIESGWDHWPDIVCHSDLLKQDYVKQFEQIIPEALRSVDTETFYWPSSPSSGGGFDNPDDENRGDTHYWSVWHGLLPFTDYRNHYFRFCSEFGFQSFPSFKTVETFTEECDRNIFSEVMESHQKNDEANGKMLYYLSENFLYPKDFDSLLYVTQILQGIAIKAGVEHWRRHRGRCMGALYWQLNDSWPVASWASIDYYGRWKALQYMAEDFFAPCAPSIMRTGESASYYVENESKENVECSVRVRLKTLDFEVLREDGAEVSLKPFEVRKLLSVDYGDLIKHQKQEVFIELSYTDSTGRSQIETETFVPYKHMHLKKPQIGVSVKETEETFEIILKTDTFAPFVELDLYSNDAVFSDNYFHLTGTEERIICLRKDEITQYRTNRNHREIKSAEDLLSELKVRSLRDTYE